MTVAQSAHHNSNPTKVHTMPRNLSSAASDELIDRMRDCISGLLEQPSGHSMAAIQERSQARKVAHTIFRETAHPEHKQMFAERYGAPFDKAIEGYGTIALKEVEKTPLPAPAPSGEMASLTAQQRDALLAGLRLLTNAMEAGAMRPDGENSDAADLLTNGGEHGGATIEDIKALADSIIDVFPAPPVAPEATRMRP